MISEKLQINYQRPLNHKNNAISGNVARITQANGRYLPHPPRRIRPKGENGAHSEPSLLLPARARSPIDSRSSSVEHCHRVQQVPSTIPPSQEHTTCIVTVGLRCSSFRLRAYIDTFDVNQKSGGANTEDRWKSQLHGHIRVRAKPTPLMRMLNRSRCPPLHAL